MELSDHTGKRQNGPSKTIPLFPLFVRLAVIIDVPMSTVYGGVTK